MTVVLEAARPVPAIARTDDHADAADALEDIITAHRRALLDLAPHQEWRSVREDTGWHMERLGRLLCHREERIQSTARSVGSRERQEESTGPDRPAR